jgi:hypothetical protein
MLGFFGAPMEMICLLVFVGMVGGLVALVVVLATKKSTGQPPQPPNLRYCSQCGQPTSPSAKFCSGCGKPLSFGDSNLTT